VLLRAARACRTRLGTSPLACSPLRARASCVAGGAAGGGERGMPGASGGALDANLAIYITRKAGTLHANLARLVDLGPPLQQQQHHRLVAVRGRQDEASQSVLQGVRVS
jgi:hypothetical protein